MLLLQAGLTEHHFVIWAERTIQATDTKPRALGVEPRQHPFAATSDELTAALTLALANNNQNISIRSELSTVWLPTIQNNPVPSSPLIGEPTIGTPTLRSWSVAACVFDANRVLDLLAGQAYNPTFAPGIGLGNTLRYWATALPFATALTAKEQFLPDVVQRDQKWFAQWTPTITGADVPRLDQFAKAMPAGCRAMGEQLPTRPARAVLLDFLAFIVNAIARGPEPLPARLQFDSVHDSWLHNLRTKTGEMRGDATEVAQLAAQIRTWRQPLTTQSAAPFRLCLRLEEPLTDVPESQEWHVRYLLQSRDDPSLQIPATDVWTGTAKTVTKLDPKPLLLAGLGQAGNLNADIEASLKTAAPSGFTTHTDGAFRFLNESAWLLEQAGFGVLLPSWWTGHNTKQRLAVSAHVKSPSMSGSGLSLEDLVQFEWKIAIGDADLTLAELKALAKLKAPLVQVRGQWVQVNADDIQAAIDLMKTKKNKASVRDVMKLALGMASEQTKLPSRGVTATGWVEQFLKQLTTNSSYTELAPPKDLNAHLRPYQLRGYSWLAFLRQWGLGACLADDMGLGKTLQTLALLLRDRDTGITKPALLICPMSVVGNWAREAAKFTPTLSILIHHGPKRAKTKASLKTAADKQAIVITSYGLLVRDRELFEPMKWSGVILDEAQMVKNPNTKMSQTARALTSDYRIALTGTPVENHVGDLWALSQFINPGFLGTQSAFREQFFVPIQRHQDDAATAQLKKLTGPFLLRRLKTDPTVISDLPPKIETTEFCTLTKEQGSLYAAVVNELEDALLGVEGIQRKGLVLGALSKLKQVCNHPAQFLGDRSAIPKRSGKLTRLTELLEEVRSTGEKALIFTQFTEMGDILQRHLQETFGEEVLFLHGGTARTKRDTMVTRFQAADGPALFLLSLKAGGTGLNLTAATHVFHFDRWWNPAVETQATDRAFRIGQTRTVQVHAFVCAGTLEEKINEMLARKRDVAARVVGTGESWLTEMNNEQLRDLLKLRPDAVEE